MTEYIPVTVTDSLAEDMVVSAFVRLRARGTAVSPPEGLDPADPHVQRAARLWAGLCVEFGLDPLAPDPFAPLN